MCDGNVRQPHRLPRPAPRSHCVRRLRSERPTDTRKGRDPDGRDRGQRQRRPVHACARGGRRPRPRAPRPYHLPLDGHLELGNNALLAAALGAGEPTERSMARAPRPESISWPPATTRPRPSGVARWGSAWPSASGFSARVRGRAEAHLACPFVRYEQPFRQIKLWLSEASAIRCERRKHTGGRRIRWPFT
jgi:hypothetical protein